MLPPGPGLIFKDMEGGQELVRIITEEEATGILKPGDVQITGPDVAAVCATLPEDDPEATQRRVLLQDLVAPYKRIVLAASHVHSRKRKRNQGWDSRQHLAECLRQHRQYFRRRGVATSLDIDPKVAFGDKGITSTANDRDVFVAFMARIGLRDSISANAIASQVVKALRTQPLTSDMPESFYGTIFQSMLSKPGQNVERPVFDEAISGTPLEEKGDEAYQLLCKVTGQLYDKVNHAIMHAHTKLQVALTLEKEGIAAFSLNTPYGLAIPFEGSLFRVYQLDQTQHVTRVCPTFFTITGGAEDDDPFELHPISHGGWSDLDSLARFRVGEVYLPVTLEQRHRVSEFAVEHCEFDLTMLDSAFQAQDPIHEEAGSGGEPTKPRRRGSTERANRSSISGIFEAWDSKTEGEEEAGSGS